MKHYFTSAAVLALVPFAATASPEMCDAAADLSVEGVTFTSATYAPMGEESPLDHCIVQATMAERTGTDGKDYAIRFELRLPDDWDGAIVHQFNGGNDGAVVPALGAITGLAPGDGALARGMAVVSSDAGHDGEANPDAGLAGGNVFGMEFEARRNYGYAAVPQVQRAAEALTTAYYDGEIEYRYGLGSSNGGRHAMVAASRMGDTFDGLLAGYPGFNLPRAAIQHAWDVQNFLRVGETLPQSFSREEMNLVGASITEACDALDGAEDGLVLDPMGCQDTFDPKSMACTDGQNSDCLPSEKVEALIAIHGGPKTSTGDALYSDWPWDPGIASGGWRFWKLESPIPPWENQPLIAVMGAGSLAQVFSTPPTEVAGSPPALQDFLTSYDFDEQAARVTATSEDFPESAVEVMTPPDMDDPMLADFVASGGKMVIFHGTADPVFSFNDTTGWYDRLSENVDNVREHVVLYPVPGMQHGQGGPAPDAFDLLTVLTDWVENGKAPGPVTATVREDNAEAPEAVRGETRPLCLYPQVARADGDGFACQ
ncbi:tannase/feruloyl esterase family alpha/beta hydrolase [Maritimibacter sp. UBA3975]|uniref:tannase/feruloyl esterase family alpha/beta hydrolase n=1 Tax=Maritimibacter sp. UBA3975 TaxID=1946833 RepID=UPI000C0B045C|nr:tannase/feruloyl esterase family alpha/beta hydrolase [Maritimibacter sp. UBA3975]MAM60374.1 tannase/feruloyl esterase family alpha/beta hydrolase [Maritimibacter sp.]|tara:strand:+ start:5345 stop:6970 length:1626 start_codon:yes stop_codon:yes gene_type:complete